MFILLNTIIDGISYGMILFMISVGLSITMGLMKVINLAHGGFALIGGSTMHVLLIEYGLSYPLALCLSVLITILFAIPMEKFLFRRIYKFSELRQVLATIGITFIIIATVNYFLGSSLLVIQLPNLIKGTIDLGFRTLPLHRLMVILAGSIVLLFLFFLIEKTRFGIRLRASVDNSDAAASLGINTSKVYSITFCIGASLAAIGGILGSELLPIDAYYPLRYMVLFLAVVSVGGMGSILGSFLASLGLGLVDTATRYFIPDVGTIVFFIAIMVILVIRPNGLLGKITK